MLLREDESEGEEPPQRSLVKEALKNGDTRNNLKIAIDDRELAEVTWHERTFENVHRSNFGFLSSHHEAVSLLVFREL